VFAAVLLLGIAEYIVFTKFPRVLGALAGLPLFLPRNVRVDEGWAAALRRVDPKGAPYREAMVPDLRPLAARLPPGRLDSPGAEATFLAGGDVVLVQVQDRIPFLTRVPFLLLARLTLRRTEDIVRVRASAYPVFAATLSLGVVVGLLAPPKPQAPYLLAALGLAWLALTVGVTRAKVVAVEDRLVDALMQSPP
jgi:hypothetical protein